MRTKYAFFIIGFMLIIIGFILYINGPERFVRFETEHLGGWNNVLSAGESERFTWVSYTESSQNFVSNVTYEVEVTTEDNPFFLHILNKSDFENYEISGIIAQTFFSKEVEARFVYSFIPEINQQYHFVVENLESINNKVLLHLWWEGNFLRFNYDIIPFYLFLIIIGIGICIYSRKPITNRIDNFFQNFSLPKYKLLDNKDDDEKIELHYNVYKSSKKLFKLWLLAWVFILLYDFFYRNLSKIIISLNNPLVIRPEHANFLNDLLLRSFISKSIWLLPFIISFPVYLFIIMPRFSDLSDLLGKRLGWRESKKQYLISKNLLKNLISNIFPFRIIILIICVLLIGVVYYFLSNVIQYSLISFFLIIASLWFSYYLWSTVEEICNRNNIGIYAKETWKKTGILNWIIAIIISWIFFSTIFLIMAPNYWALTVNFLIFSSVALLTGPLEYITIPEMYSAALFGSFLILTITILIGFLVFILFPYIFGSKSKKIKGSIVVFILTFIIEAILVLFFQGTIDIITEPLALLSPVLAAALSQLVGNRFSKIIMKRLK